MAEVGVTSGVVNSYSVAFSTSRFSVSAKCAREEGGQRRAEASQFTPAYAASWPRVRGVGCSLVTGII